MDRQYGMADFFVMEASEYLERLDGLVSAPGPPQGEDLQRLTRALRGAALMANQQPIAAAAGAFEHLARAVREGRHDWDEGTRQLAVRTVDDLRIFVRRTREWTDADTARARDLAATLERAGGRAVIPPRVMRSSSPDAGTRAFVAREGAALASTLTRVAEAVRHNPAVTDPVQTLLRQMQPLRGLATLSEYPPLPDLLDGIERAAGLVARSPAAVAAPGALLEAAAKALTKATRDITTQGKSDPDAAEVRRFAGTLRSALGLDRPDVPIESLYAHDGPPIIESPSDSSAPALGEVELTALGEHLRQIGIGLAGAGTDAQRELRILALVQPLQALETGVEAELREPVRAFARATRDAIAGNIVTRSPEPLGHAIQEAGVAVASGRTNTLARITDQLLALVGTLPPTVAPEPVVAAAEPAPPPRPTPAPAPQPAAQAEQPAPPSEPAVAPEHETPNLVGSIFRYQRLLETLGLGIPSLEELMAGAPVEPAMARVSSAAPQPAAPAPAGPVIAPVAAVPTSAALARAEAEDEIVLIEAICYSGKNALNRALSLREQVNVLVAAGAPATEVQELLEEVFDLVRLGAADIA
ncbi:MAG: hypothetical protein OEY20_11600 [Gemmatimonadota bacterium]|nr:hypothetical protein [Gemmatimonadota bacterium]MDH5197885.1 hypothetical protein [Gemmatimonadota bacterium]